MAELPRVRDGMQHSENPRKNSFLNYESAALTAELRRREAAKHCIHPSFTQALCCSCFTARTLEPSRAKLYRAVFITRGAMRHRDAATVVARRSRRFHAMRCAPEFSPVRLQNAQSARAMVRSSAKTFDDGPE
jgi:hypothetical protein